MIASIRAEFRKLLTVRSTYVLFIIAMLLTFLICFYFEGYRGVTGSAASNLASTALQEIVANGVGLAAVFINIIGILFIGHEYRYNTIMYTMTANAHRSQVLLAKMITLTIFTSISGIFFVAYAIGSYLLGVELRHAELPMQQFEVWSVMGRAAIYFAAYGLIGLFVAILFRSIIAAIAFMLMVPTSIESLLSIVLKDNSMYMPFTALDTIMGAAVIEANLSVIKAMAIAGAYLLGLGLVTWALFMHRDVN